MANEFEDDKDIDIDLDLDEEEEEDDKGEGKKKEEEGDKKPEAPEAKRARLKRQLAQLEKKHKFEDDEEDDKPSKKSSKKKDEEIVLDRVDKAVLRTEKITHPDEIELVKQIMKDTGKDLDDVLETRFFKKELESLREDRATDEALPKGSKRSSQASRDSVAYWIAKDELPPATDPELRRKVVQAKIDKEKSKSQFSDTPVIK